LSQPALPHSLSAPPRTPAYRLFEVTGIELEYPIVGPDLAVRHLVEDAFRRIAGRPTSDTEHGGAGFSNELADHVFELKTLVPARSLVEAEAALAEGVRFFNRVLADGWGARLLPTGMHPLMTPAEGRLWRRSGSAIYAAYDRVFGIGGHGWLNVQSCHLNFPFGRRDEDVVHLHEAIRALLPYLPALAASSPLVEGEPGPAVDNRLTFYGKNQARVPSIAGDVVPEPMTSPAAYRRDVLGAIYRDLAAIPEAARLRHEWVSSRGAIVRFSRRAIEIRVLDTQECPRMDVAVAAFVRGTLARLVRRLQAGDLELPPHAVLVDDYRRTVAEGTAAPVAAPHLRGPGLPAAPQPVPAGELLASLLDGARRELTRLRPVHGGDETPYLDLVAERLAGGNLSERIRARLAPVAAARRREALREVYGELAVCLDANRPWAG
jgi:gamma-glutamyl:cysteine ligase YbdK (ATP-grasp superfamily)